MRILIRTDDFGWTAEETAFPPMKVPDTGLRLARRFHAALGGLPILAATIPASLDGEAVGWLASKPAGVTVALHGWSHALRSGERNEFEGLSIPECRNLIAAGREVLGRPIHAVTPFNAASDALHEAYRLEGIRYLWSREEAWPTPPSPRRDTSPMMIPAWASLYGALGWRQGSAAEPLLETLSRGSVADAPGLVVMTLHLPWEAARDPEFKNVRMLASDRFRDLFISADEFVREIR